ncbi:MAG TPA: alanine dehydrogenase [Acidimicrobiales bacterium]|nr:alanine dehydrogenase [Acidimicrobiales bacterium]
MFSPGHAAGVHSRLSAPTSANARMNLEVLMIIGVPTEVKDGEFRVAISPAGVRELVTAGHTVLIQAGAGIGSSIHDEEFVATGGSMVADAKDIWSSADMVLKVKEPVPEEYPHLGLKANQVLFTYLHLAASRSCTEALMAAGTTAIAYETVQLGDGSLPLLTPMSEVAGRMAPLMGAHHLMSPAGGRGVLVCGIPGVRSAKVVILGAGVAGMAAATMAVGMHSDVYVLDRNLERLRQVDHHFRGGLETVASSAHAVDETCVDADIVIGAVLVVGARAPVLVSDALVARMRAGSVLVDISVDQGGCFESSRPTTHSDPTFKVHGSLFYCVSNMPGAVPHSSTHALVNATLPYALAIADLGWKEAVGADPALAAGVNVVGGDIVYPPVAAAHGLGWTPLDAHL